MPEARASRRRSQRANLILEPLEIDPRFIGVAPQAQPAPALVPAPPPSDPPWRGTDIAYFIAFTLLAMIVSMVFVGLAVAFLRQLMPVAADVQQLRDPRILLLAQTLAFSLSFVLAALWIKTGSRVPFLTAIHWSPISARVAGRLALGAIGLSIVMSALEHLLPIPKEVPIEQMFNPRTAPYLAAYGVLFAPLFEEFIFRGLMYPAFRRAFTDGMSDEDARRWLPVIWLYSTAALFASGSIWIVRRSTISAVVFWVSLALIVLAVPFTRAVAAIVRALARLQHPEMLAIVVTGVLFGMVHSAQLGWAWSLILLLSIVGIAFTAARAWTGSLVASVIMHVAYNGTLFLGLFIATRGFRDFEHLPR